MPKKTKAQPPREVTRRRLARWQREKRRRRITSAIGVLVIAAVIAVIVYGTYDTVIAPPQQWLSSVNGTRITAADYVKALRLNPYVTSPEAPLLMLEEDELVRQGAAELDIEVTYDEVTEEIKGMLFGNDTVSEEEFQQRYQEWLDTLQLSDAELREIVGTGLLQDKLEEHLKGQVPEVGEPVPQVHVLAIVVANETAAQRAMDRLDAGEDFASLAAEYGDGDLGWLPRGIKSLDFDQVAFALEPSNISEPFSINGRYYIIKVLEEGERALDEATMKKLEANALDRWLEEQREEKVERNPDIDLNAIYQWALGEIS